MNEEMRKAGMKGRAVLLVKQGRARGESDDEIFAKHPKFAYLRDFATQRADVLDRKADKNGKNGKGNIQQEFPLSEQTRLRNSKNSRIYDVPGANGEIVAKLQIYDLITDQDAEIAFLRVTNAGLDAECLRLRKELNGIKQIIEALKTLGFNPEGMLK